MGPDHKSCFSPQRSVFKSYFRQVKIHVYKFRKTISVDAIRDYIGKWHNKWLVALGTLHFINERLVLEKMFQREVINEELSMPCNIFVSPQHQI